MTTPAPVLYASISDLRLVLDSTDAGTGTAAQLSDEQLTIALESATDRVSVYTGTVYAAGAVPGIVRDLTLDLGSWWATTYYLKQKDMGPNHPVVLRYTEAKAVLEAVREGKVSLDLTTPGGPAASARVINRIPAIFTGEDSNTRVYAGQLYADVPAELSGGRRMLTDSWTWQ